MADERLILDPSELAGSRTQFDLTPWIDQEGVDWGEGDIEPFRAQGQFGETVIDYRLPNRQVTAPLVIKTVGGTAFSTVRSLIQAKAALWQREGGWIKRVTTTGGTLYADVQLSGLKLSGGWLQAHRDADIDAELRLEVSPDFYGNEVQLADHVETSAAELVFTETSVAGDYPARVRVVVDDDQGQAQLGLMWGFRKRNYSAAATARLQYEAEALQPLDTATKVALTGASGGTVVTHGTLSTNWTPVLNMNLGGTAYLTHVGSYRWWCRYRTTSGTAVQLRGVYDVGDLVLPEENPRWTHPASTAGTSFYIADLGQVRLDQVPVGTHRWAGQIQGKGNVGGENVSLDKVWFQPLDESAGMLRASPSLANGLVPLVVVDRFLQTAGALNGKTVQLGGGTWATFANGTAATDFQVDATAQTLTRTALEAGIRGAIAGSATLTNCLFQVDFSWSVLPAAGIAHKVILIVRQIDQNNFIGAAFGAAGDVELRRYSTFSAGTSSYSLLGSGKGPVWASGATYTAYVYVDTRGKIATWLVPKDGTPGAPAVQAWTSDAATGGALASGKVGLAESNQTAVASTRTYDNVLAAPIVLDAVIHASQSAELRWDGIVREDVGGTAYGPVSWPTGDLPRLPPTVEGGTVETFVKASRGDFDQLPDVGIDDISARLSVRPCWLFPNS